MDRRTNASKTNRPARLPKLSKQDRTAEIQDQLHSVLVLLKLARRELADVLSHSDNEEIKDRCTRALKALDHGDGVTSQAEFAHSAATLQAIDESIDAGDARAAAKGLVLAA